MNDKELVGRLRGFLQQRRQVQLVEKALQELTPAERIILDRLVMRPRKYAGQELCQLLGVEIATVYRQKNKALEKVKKVLEGAL